MSMETISQATLKTLVEANVIRGALVIGQSNGFYISIKYGMTEKILAAKAGNVRLFRSMDTVVDYLRQTIGIARFEEDSANYNSHAQMSLSGRKRPDRQKAMKQAHEAAEHQSMIDQQLHQALAKNAAGKAVWHDIQEVRHDLLGDACAS